MDLGKNRTNRQFLKTRPDARTEAQKEDVSGETRTYGKPRPKRILAIFATLTPLRPLLSHVTPLVT